MRIISGKYKGKIIDGFDIDGTRPTMDRVKESLFAMIQDYIKDSVCLDLFAGSGSLGIEAISNGAHSCYFVDKHKDISKILKNNLKNIENSYFIQSDYMDALKILKNIKFDIVFLDPPYKENLITPAINEIVKNDMLSENAIIICEYETEKIETNLSIWKQKKYGTKQIIIYKNEKK